MKERIFIIFLLLILMLSLITDAGASSPGHGYLWSLNIEKDLKDENFTGVARGTRVMGLYLEHPKMQGDMYNCSFSGILYSNTYLNGKLNMVRLSQSMVWKNLIVQRWINYEGYFLLVRYNTTHNGKTQNFYGIKAIGIHIYTKQPERARGEIIYTMPIAGRVVERNDYSLKYDIYLEINYSKPVPYIPIGQDENVSYYTNANFYGKIVAGGVGYSKINNITSNLNRTISKKISGSVQMKVQMEARGNIIRRSGIIELLPMEIGMMSAGIIYHPNDTFYGAIPFATMLQNRGIMDNGSYKKITLSKYTFGMREYPSKSVSREENLNLREKDPERGNLNTFEIYISTGIPLFLSVLLIASGFKARRGHRGTT